MRNPFYQANFCAECGNQIAERFGFKAQYFCDDCASRLKQRRLFTPLAGTLLAASLVVFAFSFKSAGTRSSPPSVPTAPVSARDSVVNPTLRPRAEGGARVFCGARTRRGTPCRHLVPAGERCAQHRGLPSLLAGQQGEINKPAKARTRR